MEKFEICIIAAKGENWGIGLDNKMPWNLKPDLKHFKEVTMGYPVIMGRKTFDSIGRALPGRRNIVISRKMGPKDGIDVAKSLDEAIRLAKETGAKKCFIIGGANIYRQAIGIADRIYLTEIAKSFVADAFFPAIDMNDWSLEKNSRISFDEESGLAYVFTEYVRKGQ